jgi:transcriptional regulator with XRE-family HTH domain
MKDLSPIVSHNLAELRKSRGLTQGELAEKFAYTDKSISKWEHGDALPDLNTLQELADFYGVTLDYLTHEESDDSLVEMGKIDPKAQEVNKKIIAALGVIFIWTIASVLFASFTIIPNHWHPWLAFVWSTPASLFTLILANGAWGKKEYRAPLWIAFFWFLVGAIYLELGMDLADGFGWKCWFILVIAVPLTISAFLMEKIKR